MGKDINGKEIGDNISQRKDGRYCARYIDRFGNRKSIYNRNLKELKVQLRNAVYENQNELNAIDDGITLDEWFKKWMQVYKIPVVRLNTKRHYEHVYTKHISPTLGMLKITQITQLQVKSLINKVNDAGYQWETQNKIRILLIDMFDRAMEDNFVKRNPAKGVRLGKNKPNDRYILSVENQAEFFNCSAGTFYNNLFVVAVNTGLRPGELFALSWDDVDFDNMQLNVDKTLVYQKFDNDEGKTFHLGPPKTEKSVRKVPINRQCEIALKRQYMLKNVIAKRNVKQVEFSDRLFVTKFNTPLNSVLYSAAIKKILDEINIQKDNSEVIEDFSGHTFRHTFATRCIENGVNPKVLQKYLGHATLQMTMDLYVHTTDNFKKSEMEKLSNAMDNIRITDDTIEHQYEIKQKVVDFAGVKMA
ncbi:MAG: tyrosine-type recombinase/integrase [Eubacteriales bacterium]|nr:tyrosine-type recombinase/integrase [Eubacteriales bacterium]